MALYDLFPKVMNMSLTASVVIVCVLLGRLLLKKAPKVFSYALWSVVLFRLLCPVSFSVDFSVLRLVDAPAAVVTEHASTVEFVTEELVFPGEALKEMPTEDPGVGKTGFHPVQALSWVWIGGMAVMGLRSLWSLVRLKRKTAEAAPLRENIYEADGLDTAFVMGLLCPRIYLPSGLTESERAFILLHEEHHVWRLDHLVKVISYGALCVHWFNPLVWLAFWLAERDMEMSCDEAVLKRLGAEHRCDYSQTLLRLSSGKRRIVGAPLGFCEGNTKERVKNVLNWKKPGVWVTGFCCMVCVAVLAACGTNPAAETTVPPTVTEPVAGTELERVQEELEEIQTELENVQTEYERDRQHNTRTVKTDLVGYANVEIELPEGWEYEIEEYAEDCYNCGIRFWPKECPEGKVGLYYYPQGFGVCGTGLIECEMLADNGEIVVLGFYDGGHLMSFCSYGNDYAAISEGIEEFPEYEETVLQILRSARLNQGVLPEDEALAQLRSEGMLDGDWERYRAKFDPVEGVWTFMFYENDYNNPKQIACVDWDGHCWRHGEENTHHSESGHHSGHHHDG